jgi:hypothetical protein
VEELKVGNINHSISSYFSTPLTPIFSLKGKEEEAKCEPFEMI